MFVTAFVQAEFCDKNHRLIPLVPGESVIFYAAVRR
jgi:hypothetical protein